MISDQAFNALAEHAPELAVSINGLTIAVGKVGDGSVLTGFGLIAIAFVWLLKEVGLLKRCKCGR